MPAPSECDELRAEVEHLKSELGEATDLYTTYRGLVVDGMDITTLIMALRKQIAERNADVERLIAEVGRLRALLPADRHDEMAYLWRTAND